MDLPFFEPRPTPCHTWVCYCHAVSDLAGCIHWAFILKAFFEYQLGDILTAVIYCLQNHLLTFTTQKAGTYAVPIEKIRDPWKNLVCINPTQVNSNLSRIWLCCVAYLLQTGENLFTPLRQHPTIHTFNIMPFLCKVYIFLQKLFRNQAENMCSQAASGLNRQKITQEFFPNQSHIFGFYTYVW